MASTYQALTREIEALKKKADIARKHEAAQLVALIKSGIEMYGLTAQDLGLDSGAKAAKKSTKAAAPSKDKSAATAGATPVAKYVDDAGHSWSGRGPKPGWVKAALNAGQTLDDFLATAKPKSTPTGEVAARKSKAVAKEAAKPAKKAAGKSSRTKAVETAAQPTTPVSIVKYKDDAGNSWSGRGPKPGWLRAAIEAGRSLEDFLA